MQRLHNFDIFSWFMSPILDPLRSHPSDARIDRQPFWPIDLSDAESIRCQLRRRVVAFPAKGIDAEQEAALAGESPGRRQCSGAAATRHRRRRRQQQQEPQTLTTLSEPELSIIYSWNSSSYGQTFVKLGNLYCYTYEDLEPWLPRQLELS